MRGRLCPSVRKICRAVSLWTRGVIGLGRCAAARLLQNAVARHWVSNPGIGEQIETMPGVSAGLSAAAPRAVIRCAEQGHWRLAYLRRRGVFGVRVKVASC